MPVCMRLLGACDRLVWLFEDNTAWAQGLLVLWLSVLASEILSVLPGDAGDRLLF